MRWPPGTAWLVTGARSWAAPSVRLPGVVANDGDEALMNCPKKAAEQRDNRWRGEHRASAKGCSIATAPCELSNLVG